jgi:VWFA-related protein
MAVRLSVFCAFCAGFICLVCIPLPAQESNAPVIRSTTQEVLLDVVVRDKKERLIPNLKPEDIRVLEDGVPQKVKGFRFTDTESEEPLLAAAPATGPKSAAPSDPTLNPLHNLNLVTIVFEQMGPGSRLFAEHAALQFLENEFRSNTYGGVYSLDLRLNALQPYTNNQELLRKAIALATTGNYTEFRKDSENVLNNLGVEISGGRGGITVATAGGDPFQSPAAAVSGAQTPDMNSAGQMAIARMVWKQMEMVTYGVGWRSLDGLLALIQAQTALPGRKTVLLLSEGIVVPWTLTNVFQSIISAANRANVSVYCVDVTGLTTKSPGQASTDLLRTAGSISANQNMGTNRAGQPNSADANVDMFKEDEVVNMSMHANPQAAMEELAESTGGFLISNTNDTAKPLHRVMEDVRAHYELTYTPVSQNYDGHFRKIEVQVLRTGAQVHTRAGYFALPMLAGEVLQPFEMPGLNALNTKPQPNAFAYQAQALPFRAAPGAVQYAVVFEVPLQNLAFREDKQAAKLRTHVSLLALVKDADGQVAGKVSRDLANDIPADKFEAFSRGNLIFTQPMLLAPGRYTVETAVVDRENGASSVRREALFASDMPGVGLSSVIVVRRVDPLNGGRDLTDPLQFAGGKITPSLGGVYGAETEIPLFLVVYPVPGAGASRLSIEVFEDGKLVSTVSPELPPPDETGTIPFMGSIQPAPGQYEVKVTVRQGATAATRMLALRVK